MLKISVSIFSALSFFFLVVSPTLAHRPVIEPAVVSNYDKSDSLIFKSILIQDPTVASQAIYGNLSEATNFDAYAFVPSKDVTIPVGLLVPARNRNIQFAPDLYVIGKNIPEANTDSSGVPIALPEGYGYLKLGFPTERTAEIEPYSLEKLWQGPELNLTVTTESNYYLLIVEPEGRLGDYVLAVGDAEDFSNVSWGRLMSNWFNLKLGTVGDISPNWSELMGLFLAILGLAIGLGVGLFTDILAWLGRKSASWANALSAIYTVSQSALWIGLLVYVFGLVVLYQTSGIGGVAIFQILLIAMVIANGFWMSFKLAPALLARQQAGQQDQPLSKQTYDWFSIGLLFSLVGWFGNLLFLIWHIVVLR